MCIVFKVYFHDCLSTICEVNQTGQTEICFFNVRMVEEGERMTELYCYSKLKNQRKTSCFSAFTPWMMPLAIPQMCLGHEWERVAMFWREGLLTSSRRGAFVTARAPGFAHTAAAELFAQLGRHWVQTLPPRADKTEASALLALDDRRIGWRGAPAEEEQGKPQM